MTSVSVYLYSSSILQKLIHRSTEFRLASGSHNKKDLSQGHTISLTSSNTWGKTQRERTKMLRSEDVF